MKKRLMVYGLHACNIIGYLALVVIEILDVQYNSTMQCCPPCYCSIIIEVSTFSIKFFDILALL